MVCQYATERREDKRYVIEMLVLDLVLLLTLHPLKPI
jgi:hypothetical protein